MKQTLNLNLSQKLSLTPQLKQSLRLLQLSSLDLEQEIQQNLESNPLLERIDSDTFTHSEVEIDTEFSGSENQSTQNLSEVEPNEDLTPIQDRLISLQEVGTAARANLDSASISRINGSGPGDEFTQYISKQKNLFEHLYWQIQMTSLSDRDKLIAETVLRCLDEDGYLEMESAEITQLFSPGLVVEEDEVNAMLSLVKTLDPIGVGAKNLQERLLILLNHTPRRSPGLAIAKSIVNDHFSLLATRNFTKLRAELGVSESTMATCLGLITQLNPRIASIFGTESRDYIIPDLMVSKVEGRWMAQLNPDNQIKLRTNQEYADLLKSDIGKQDSSYIQHNLAQAKLFIKGLMSRYDTLLLVGQTIVERQQAFFEQGEDQMHAMVLQDIAQRLEMHESTISRATAGKFLLCARGVFELKYFFPSGTTTIDGTGSSSTAIRALIKKMINKESKLKPLSDSKIVQELTLQGHVVARRTVAKYRESMQIAPSSQRKSLP